VTGDKSTSGTLRLESVSSVTWIDGDGTKYRREWRNGEIRDVPIGRSTDTGTDQ